MRKGVLKVTVCCLMGCILLANPFMTVDVYSLSGALPVAGSASVLNGSRDGNTANKNTKGTSSSGNSKTTSLSQTKKKVLVSAGASSAVSEAKKEEVSIAKKEDKKEDENQNKDREIEEKKTGLPAAGEQKVIGTENDSEVEQEEQLEQVQEEAAEEVEEPIEEAQEEDVGGLVIAQVSNYVNVRGSASEEGEVVGKLYNHSAGELVKKEGDWYQITSGDVTGYVKAEFVVTGEAAVELAKEVGNRIAVVNTTTLKVRQSPDTEASVLGLVPEGDVLTVSEEQEGWVKVSIEEGEGYVSTDYVHVSTEFVRAESKEAEEVRLAKEEEERQKALEAAEQAERERREREEEQRQEEENTVSENIADGIEESHVVQAPVAEPPKKEEAPSAQMVTGSGMGANVANFATQFVGNPYVYGGSSLTNGTDCSGFTMSVYRNFGISLPHSSGGQRAVGYDVGGLANAQPGDLVCYSGHVGLYIGNGQIVHASTPSSGIKISNAAYKPVVCVRRIF
ncbi:hypothetical protein D7X25_30685 [bacterium 1XD42-8]|jgi:cell wall-associated NlpC family hydrolase|nr:SH3 domain-containing protein [Lachnospiraceae bacterium]RKJ38239.1 hypothetical protein D7X25_30685 [bacterium 1XD42-8]